MKEYKKYVLAGVFACFMAVALMMPIEKTEAFWPFSKAKKENNVNYAGAAANTESDETKPIPSITVIFPNGGETLQAGKPYTIKWKSKGISKKDEISIILEERYKNEDKVTQSFIANAANKGFYKWLVPKDKSGTGNAFRIGLQTKEKPYFSDWGDGVFSIADNNTSLITVISPNGGEVWKIGEIKTIKWKSKGIPLDAQIDIDIFEEGTDKEKSTAIFNGLSATTTLYEWKVGGGIVEAGKKYKILIKSHPIRGGLYIATDESDGFFSIKGKGVVTNTPPEIKKVSLRKTEGGGDIKVGDSVLVGAEGFDADKDNLAWNFNWGDGTGTAKSCDYQAGQKKEGWEFEAVHSWEEKGTYTIDIVANDCRGGTDKYAMTIIVESR